jgi:hypothetical protein
MSSFPRAVMLVRQAWYYRKDPNIWSTEYYKLSHIINLQSHCQTNKINSNSKSSLLLLLHQRLRCKNPFTVS